MTTSFYIIFCKCLLLNVNVHMQNIFSFMERTERVNNGFQKFSTDNKIKFETMKFNVEKDRSDKFLDILF